VATLFEYSPSLVHAETWLKEQKLASTESNGSAGPDIFSEVRSLLTKILPDIQELEVSVERGIRVNSREFGNIPLEGLSDGYLTTIGWVIDLVARWIHWARLHRVSIGSPFYEYMTGLVLIDELDLHLHPQWQVRVVTDLRKVFPRMTFIVTTHNPMTLMGARTGEIFVLSRDPNTKRIEAKQKDIPPGTRADQALTGDWFELSSSLLDEVTIDLLEEHRRLIRSPGPNPRA